MADYAIGDVQGCYDPLQRLLEKLGFDDQKDQLWLVGDLVNRGKQSLEVLRFLQKLKNKPKIALGNHDLHLLYRLFVDPVSTSQKDTLKAVIEAPDSIGLGHWLRKQPIICYSMELNVVMVHAGIAPMWDLAQAKAHALELEKVLAGDDFCEFLKQMYGNKPGRWSDDLVGMDRLRVITNYFTRMRFCDAQGSLDFDHTGTTAPDNLYPWFACPGRKILEVDLVFGHWAALMGVCPSPNVYAIDTGCVWGGKLTAICLQNKQRVSVDVDSL